MLGALIKSVSALRLQSTPAFKGFHAQTAFLATKAKKIPEKPLLKKATTKPGAKALAKPAKKAADKPFEIKVKKAKKVILKPIKVKIPKAPKKRETTLSLFVKENWSKFASPETKTVDTFAKIIGKFKELGAKDLESYKERALKITEARAEEYRAWKESLTSKQIAAFNANLKKRGKIGKLVDPSKPKMARSSYLLYCMDARKSPEFSGLSITEAAKLSGKKWSEMSDSQKKKYVDLSNAEKAEYFMKREDFKSKLSEEALN